MTTEYQYSKKDIVDLAKEILNTIEIAEKANEKKILQMSDFLYTIIFDMKRLVTRLDEKIF